MVIPDNSPLSDSELNDQLDWWNRSTQRLSFASYEVDGCLIMVGDRPDFKGTTPDFFKSVDGWINVSDRLVRYPNNVSTLWAPWNESGTPTLETIFSVLKTLRSWIVDNKKRTVYIHCDGGTHRAVTLFGFYLLSYYPDTAGQLEQQYKLTARREWSSPLEYARGYLRSNPEFFLLINSIAKSQDSFSHGASLSQLLKEEVGYDVLELYNKSRFINETTPLTWSRLLIDLKYCLVITPWWRLRNGLDKKLNTKRGQKLKRLGL